MSSICGYDRILEPSFLLHHLLNTIQWYVPFTRHFVLLHSHEIIAAWENISLHILNTVMAAFEILFTSAGLLPWLGLPFMILILALYTASAYITHATQGFYRMSSHSSF